MCIRDSNKTILMGYTTYQAIGRPLPNRKTIVVSFEPFDDERVEVRTSLEDVIEEYKQRNEDLFISGGASIYKQSLPLADQLLISRIPGSHTGETYFPDFNAVTTAFPSDSLILTTSFPSVTSHVIV